MVLTNGGWTQRTARGEPRATHPPTLILPPANGTTGHDGLLFGIREVQAAFHAAAFQQGPE